MQFSIEKITKENGEVSYALYKYPEAFGAESQLPFPVPKELLVKGLFSVEEAEAYAQAYVECKVKSVETVKTFNI
jgi:hypothetical protein